MPLSKLRRPKHKGPTKSKKQSATLPGDTVVNGIMASLIDENASLKRSQEILTKIILAVFAQAGMTELTVPAELLEPSEYNAFKTAFEDDGTFTISLYATE